MKQTAALLRTISGGSGQGVDREGATAIDLSGWLGSHCVDLVEIDSGKKVLGLKINQPAKTMARQASKITLYGHPVVEDNYLAEILFHILDAHSVQKRIARAMGNTMR
ncbi:hypothetical protein E4U52_007517 [Claviceps spartinae]|nr:hypothetical protein E4U52_007517 [Claviceps spartinae]